MRHAIRGGWRLRPPEVDQAQAALIVPWSSMADQLLRLLGVARLRSATQLVLMDSLQQLCWRSGFRRRLLSGSELDGVLGRFREANRALAAEYGLQATAEDLFIVPETDLVDAVDPLVNSDAFVRTLAEPLPGILAARVLAAQTEAAKNPDATSERTLAGFQEQIAVLRALRDQLLRDIDER